MANLSDVYDINFEASSEELAKALVKYLKAIDKADLYYGTLGNPKRNGKTITGDGVMGRWVYSNNLEGTFERPEEWLDDTLPKAEWLAVKKLLKAGETIDVDYSEDEGGCGVYQDGWGQIGMDDKGKVYVRIDFEEHDRPDCEIIEHKGKWYCEDHDHEQKEFARYCEEVEE